MEYNKQEPFKQKADAGRLMAAESKMSQLSPDYYGEIAINLKDMANVQTVDGLHVFKLSGWKKQSKAGKTYLSISIKRKVAESAAKPQPAAKSSGFDDMADDVPF